MPFQSTPLPGAGIVILVLDEEHDIFKMGGLRKKCLLSSILSIGSASLSALPLIYCRFLIARTRYYGMSFHHKAGA